MFGRSPNARLALRDRFNKQVFAIVDRNIQPLIIIMTSLQNPSTIVIDTLVSKLWKNLCPDQSWSLSQA
jgi:hypothetical protein